jgi:molybdate transport system ATP-binding protein
MSSERSLYVRAKHQHPGGGFAVDVEIEAAPGVTILFGPSGAGKSTLLSIVAGLVHPDEGIVKLGADTWLDTSAKIAWPPERRRAAYVFQSLALFPHMTAAQNVAFGVDRALSRVEREDRARASLARFRVAHLAGRRPKTFSGGEAQRVALARAFAMSPRIVLLDEPFSSLDAELRYEFVADVRTASRELGVPVLHVTHDRAEARVLGDQVVCMSQGQVVARGAPEHALGEPVAPRRSARPSEEEAKHDRSDA